MSSTNELCYNVVMQRSVLRYLLTCFLLAALPIKGIAAVTMVGCGPEHHPMGGVVDKVGKLTKSGSHDHDRGSGVAHHHSVASSEGSGTGISNPAADNPSPAGQTPHANTLFKCSSCAPCCAGAALTSDTLLHVASPVSSADFPVPFSILRSVPIGRLDRPPRFILA